jgi:hypothetical protein
MKKILLIILFYITPLFAQEFIIEKISGNVLVMKGTAEEWISVKTGQKLSGDDLIATAGKSFIQLSNKEGRFILQSNSALNLNAVKKLSINELLLALAAEEIRNIPSGKSKSGLKNTAVYGKEESRGKILVPSLKELGNKKINGARQLAESGYKESALVVAKETYRKYPETKSNFEDRLYFVDIMMNLNLKSEAASELKDIKDAKPNVAVIKEVDLRLDRIKEENRKIK